MKAEWHPSEAWGGIVVYDMEGDLTPLSKTLPIAAFSGGDEAQVWAETAEVEFLPSGHSLRQKPERSWKEPKRYDLYIGGYLTDTGFCEPLPDAEIVRKWLRVRSIPFIRYTPWWVGDDADEENFKETMGEVYQEEGKPNG